MDKDPYYLVAMDKDDAQRKTVFNTDDLETGTE
jgi:hypothetical protein